ncbi:MAG: SPOR domain-containing protein [Gammaproteobacteria bacterium]
MQLITSSTKPLLLIVLFGILTACSGKPSPWAEKSSPWGDESADQQGVSDEVVGANEPAMIEDMVGVAGMDDATMVESTVNVMPQAGDLRSVPANYFTVQVCASSSMENLRFFARQHNLSAQWAARTNVNGKNWYVLLLGVYPTRGEAVSALADVRNRLDTTPWVRSMGSLQAVMIQ